MVSVKGLIVGGGAVGVDFHLPRLFSILDIQEIVIVESDERRRAYLVKKYSKHNRVSIQNNVPKCAFDIAVIATPPKYHLEVFREALKQDCKKILVEKPMTIGLTEAETMLSLAEKHDAKVFLAHIRRSMTSFGWMKKCYQNNTFGTLKRVCLNEGNIFGWNAASIGSFSKQLNGGGVLMDTGPHAIDQIYQIFDTLSLDSCKMDAIPERSSKAIEANAYLELVADDAVPVSVLLSRNRVLSNLAKFEFENLDVCLGLQNNLITLQPKSGDRLVGTFGELQPPMTFTDLFDAYYNKFLRVNINDGVSPRDGIKVQAILQESYQSAVKIEGGF